MRPTKSSPLMLKAALAAIALAVPLVAYAATTLHVTLNDPAGDDFGPGTYQYPTDAVYKRGSFDLRGLEVTERDDSIEFKVSVDARIEDPWNSKDWDGNGFSLQFVQIYIDTDHQKGVGFVEPLPGLGKVAFAAEEAWDKVVLISPQGRTRLEAEVRYKAPKMGGAVVIPKRTSARGKQLVAVVKKADLGVPNGKWGFQAVMQSNEGYPDKSDILTRRVNEVRGEHRFGGGHDTDCDPHVLDILAGSAKGDKAEIAAQKSALSWTCGSKVAQIPMIYPAAR
jgi:carbohydrate-binding DOMON domain-containing protein